MSGLLRLDSAVWIICLTTAMTRLVLNARSPVAAEVTEPVHTSKWSLKDNLTHKSIGNGHFRSNKQEDMGRHTVCNKEIPFHNLDFLTPSEFSYGQIALYGEPCDYEAYKKHALNVWQLGIDTDNWPEGKILWVVAQQQLFQKMKSNFNLRSAICNGRQLMQCSNSNKDKPVCECLCLPPIYNLVYDNYAKECRARDGSRCFSPLGFDCLEGSLCMQANQEGHDAGQCICARNGSLKGENTCTGCSKVFPQTNFTILKMTPDHCKSGKPVSGSSDGNVTDNVSFKPNNDSSFNISNN